MIQSYLAGLLTFLVVDTLWIRNVVIGLYIKHVPEILSKDETGLVARKAPALLFYFIFYTVLFYFCINYAKTLKESVCTGALIGLITYSTYTLTNHTVMKQWNWWLSISDILWGVVLCSIIATVIHYNKS